MNWITFKDEDSSQLPIIVCNWDGGWPKCSSLYEILMYNFSGSYKAWIDSNNLVLASDAKEANHAQGRTSITTNNLCLECELGTAIVLGTICITHWQQFRLLPALDWLQQLVSQNRCKQCKLNSKLNIHHHNQSMPVIQIEAGQSVWVYMK